MISYSSVVLFILTLFFLLCLHIPSEYFILEKLLQCKEEQKTFFFATGDGLVLNN